MQALNELVLDERYHDVLSILKGARNGFVYGVKIRFPHALLMSILFGKGSWPERSKAIYRATRQHALNLASFVTIYKTLLLIQRRLSRGKENGSHAFLAGLLGGYIVFGDRNAVNEQIVLYVCSRVVASFIPRARSPAPDLSRFANPIQKPIPPDARLFSAFAALSWGAVMWLFVSRGQTLQPGLHSSMRYLYRDSETWRNLKTLIWQNK